MESNSPSFKKLSSKNINELLMNHRKSTLMNRMISSFSRQIDINKRNDNSLVSIQNDSGISIFNCTPKISRKRTQILQCKRIQSSIKSSRNSSNPKIDLIKSKQFILRPKTKRLQSYDRQTPIGNTFQKKRSNDFPKIINVNNKRSLKEVSLIAYEGEKSKVSQLLFDPSIKVNKKQLFLQTFLQKLSTPSFVDSLFNAKYISQ